MVVALALRQKRPNVGGACTAGSIMIVIGAVALFAVLLAIALLDILAWGVVFAIIALAAVALAATLGSEGIQAAIFLAVVSATAYFICRYAIRFWRKLKAKKGLPGPPAGDAAARLRWANREGEYSDD